MTSLNAEEMKAWDEYAAGALAVCAAASGQTGYAPSKMAELAADIADHLIVERRKRAPAKHLQAGVLLPSKLRD